MVNASIRNRLDDYLVNAKLISWGLDWLTATSASASGQTQMKLFWAKNAPQLERLGFTQKKSGNQGYVGISCGPLFLGGRADGMMIRASGPLSAELFKALDWEHSKATRLDIQATLQFREYYADTAVDLGAWRAALAKDRGEKMLPKQRLEGGYGEGDTLYIGGRGCPRFGRIYDKEKQSKDETFARCWRFELEYKKMMAPKAVQMIQENGGLGQILLDILAGQLADWELDVIFSRNPVLVPGSIGRRAYDTDRSMTWLRQQVAPTIERLLGTIGSYDIELALGLRQPSMDENERVALWESNMREESIKEQ